MEIREQPWVLILWCLLPVRFCFNYVYVCISVYRYVYGVQVSLETTGVGSSGVTGGCELPGEGAGN